MITPAAIREILDAGGPQVVFQPIVSLVHNGVVEGYEALSRFPDYGPHLWFAAAWAEGLGLMLELAAIRNAIANFRSGLGYLAVNVSPNALAAPDMFGLLSANHHPIQVVVELSESKAIKNYTLIREVMTQLRAVGVQLSIDDLGAGFSSLLHVLELEPECLKIDMRFTQKVPHDHRFNAIIAAIVAMGRALGVASIAEGIESQQQLDGLKVLGVASGQGWLLGVPGDLPEAA